MEMLHGVWRLEGFFSIGVFEKCVHRGAAFSALRRDPRGHACKSGLLLSTVSGTPVSEISKNRGASTHIYTNSFPPHCRTCPQAFRCRAFAIPSAADWDATRIAAIRPSLSRHLRRVQYCGPLPVQRAIARGLQQQLCRGVRRSIQRKPRCSPRSRSSGSAAPRTSSTADSSRTAHANTCMPCRQIAAPPWRARRRAVDAWRWFDLLAAPIAVAEAVARGRLVAARGAVEPPQAAVSFRLHFPPEMRIAPARYSRHQFSLACIPGGHHISSFCTHYLASCRPCLSVACASAMPPSPGPSA